MKLQDLTKSELIALIGSRLFTPFTQREMAAVRWERLQNMAAAKRQESIELGKKSDVKSFWQSQKSWSDAERLTNRANKIYKKYMGATSHD